MCNTVEKLATLNGHYPVSVQFWGNPVVGLIVWIAVGYMIDAEDLIGALYNPGIA